MDAYRIETERLIIRCYEPADAPLLKKSLDLSNDHLLPWMPWAKNDPEPLEEKIKRLRKCRGEFDLDIDYYYGVFDKAETTLIGSSGLHTRRGETIFEIGYWISVDQINQGYAQEVTQALTKVGFELTDRTLIEIHCDPENIRSSNIPKKLGYTLIATPFNEERQKDDMQWVLTKDDYESTPSKNLPIKVFDSVGRQIL